MRDKSGAHRSQIEVTGRVVELASQVGDIRYPGDLIVLRDLLFSHLSLRPYDVSTWAHERAIRWRRTAAEILEDGFVYDTKACTDIVIVFCALCRAKGLDTRFVKVRRGGRIHSLAEIRLPDGWYIFDVTLRGVVPVVGEVTEDTDYNGWRLWKKGRDARALGLTDSDSIWKMFYGESSANAV